MKSQWILEFAKYSVRRHSFQWFSGPYGIDNLAMMFISVMFRLYIVFFYSDDSYCAA